MQTKNEWQKNDANPDIKNDLVLEEDLSHQEHSQPILSLNRVNKYFKKQGTFFRAINEATFEVNQGDFFGIIGESGSGKSTTGKMIIRLLSTSGGTIIFDKNLISQEKISKKTARWLTQNMQMIFQDPMSSLNPKKNVLNLISEPFRINKKLRKEASQIIKDHGMINPYFQYTYKEQDYLITKQFNEDYYKPMIALHETYLDSIKKYKFDQDENNEESLYDLSSFLSGMEDDAKKINNNIYGYAKSIKDIFYTCLNKHKNKENHPLEVALFDIKIKIKEIKKYQYNQRGYWDNLALKKENFKKADEYLNEFNEIYVKQGKTFLNSIHDSYRSDLKALKQELSITVKYTNALYLKVQSISLELFIKTFNEVRKLNYLSIEQTHNLTKQLKHACDEILMGLTNDVLNLKDLEKAKDDFFNTLVTNNELLAAEADLLNKVNLKELHENKDLEQLIVQKFNEYKEEYFALLNEISDKINKIEQGINSYKNFDLSTYPILMSIIKEAQKLSYDTEIKYLDNVRAFEQKNDLYQENLDLYLAQLHDWKKSSAAKQAKQDYLDALRTLNNAKQACQTHYNQDIAEFNKNIQPQINSFKKELHTNSRKLSKLRTQYKIELIKIALKAIKHAWQIDKTKSFFKKIVLWNEQRKSIQREIFTKIKNQSALKFEFETTMEEVDLFRTLRSKNPLVRVLNKRFLIQVLTRQKVYEALNSVGLKNEHAYRYPHEFSGGQRQRIVIARALINNPKLIIADEPISALDVSIQAQVINIMKRLAKEKGITFLFIAHDLSMVNYACNRMIIMHNGRIVEKGNTNEIFNNPIHPYTLSLIKAAPQLSKIHVDLASFSALENYTTNYSILNKPEYYKINSDTEHYVFCTLNQLKEWDKNFKCDSKNAIKED